MRVYLASEGRGPGIKLANIINSSGSTCIIGDVDSDDYRALIKGIRDSADDFDLSILVSRNPMAAAMEANRTAGLRASVCKDPEDAAEAMEAKANLIVLDEAKLGKEGIQGILESCDSAMGGGKQHARPERAEAHKEKGQRRWGFADSVKGMFGASDDYVGREHVQNKREETRKERDEEPEPRERRKRGSGGMLDSLKDTFGIE